jgi:hypothetical protein
MITFNEETHEYKVDGVVKKSVTQLLKEAGIIDYEGVDEYYRLRGTYVHEACALYAQGWLDWSSLSSDILPFVENFKCLYDRLRLSYVSAEVPSYIDNVYWCSECNKPVRDVVIEAEYGETVCGDCECILDGCFLDLCGSYDMIVMWKGKRTLVEIKTGTFPMWGGLQLAAYESMVDVDDVLGISLKDEKVFVKADDFNENHKVLHDIKSGTFDLDTWKSNRKRRHMKVLKEVA